MGFDLHTHSACSDGALAPAEVVADAREAGLEGMALTDHDTLDGIDEAMRAGRELGIEVFAGLELSTVSGRRPVHMLGLFVDTGHEELRAHLDFLKRDRVARARKTVEKLNELGAPVSFERVLAIAGAGSVGRPHIAKAMVEAGVVPTANAAFTPEWIGNGGRAYTEHDATTPLEGVALIRSAGGAAVLAHPIWTTNDRSLTEADIEALAEAGLAGIEVDHPDHDPAARERYGALARRLDLVPTGASDFHGNEHGGTVIGCDTTDRGTVERLRERAGR